MPAVLASLKDKLRVVVLVLACFSFVPSAHAACAASGTPLFGGGVENPDTNGGIFFTESGGSGSVSFSFSAPSGCTFYVSSDSSWLTTSQPSSAPNDGTSATITFNVASNSASYRTGHLTAYVNGSAVASRAIDENSSRCTTTITSQNPVSVPASGGSYSYTFNLGGCEYVGPAVSASWVQVTSYGTNSIAYNVSANTGAARSATLTFSDPPGQSLQVNQAAAGSSAAPSIYSINPNSGAQGTSVPLTISGANFVPGATTIQYSYSVVSFSNTVVTSTQISTTLNIPSYASLGTFSISVVTNAGSSSPVGFTITAPAVTQLTLSCSPTSGPTMVGTPYTATCTVTGGLAPYAWSISSGTGSLPAGLSLNANGSSATIGGTPTGVGALGYSYTVRVVDSSASPQSATQSYNGALLAPPTLSSINPNNGAPGASVPVTLTGTNFGPGAEILVNNTSLAVTNVNIMSTTQITATFVIAANAASGSANVSVLTAGGTSGTVSFTIAAALTPLNLSCNPTAGPTAVGASYLSSCTASGGLGPYSWSIAAGALPQGLSLSGTTGSVVSISGPPSSPGPYSFSLRVTDSSSPQQTKSQLYSGTLTQPAPAITSLNCSGANGPATVGVRYADTCTAPGGLAPFSWSISGGSLPAGLTLNSSTSGTATISGTPSSAGPYSYSLKTTDSTSPTPLTGSQAFSGSIAQAGSPTLTAAPTSVSFSYRPDIGLPVPQSLSVFTTGTSTSFSVAVVGSFLLATPSNGTTPGTVLVSAVNLVGLAPGTYTGQVTINAANVNPPSVTIPVTLLVQAVPPPQLTLSQTQLSYGLTPGSAPVQAQILVSNQGGGSVSFTTAVTGCSCVSVSTAAGQATAGAPAAVNFAVNPAGLPPSTYSSQIVVNGSDGEQLTLPVKTAVNSLSQSMDLTQTGMLFGTVAQGGTPPPQSFNILNSGQGTMNWTSQVQTLSGTTGWLSISPAAGSVPAGSISPPVAVTVNPTGLPVGQYYALVQILAASAGNSPQVLSIFLNVVDPSQGVVLVSPLGLLVGSVGTTNLQGTLTIYNLSTQAVSYSSTASTTDGANWLGVSPASGTIPAAGSTQATVTANGTLLPSGTGQGLIRVGFSNGIVQTIGVSSLSVAGSASGNNVERPDQSSGCRTSSLVPVVTSSIGPSFTVTQSQSTSLVVSLFDNCHNTVQSATVFATFTNGDSQLTLKPQGGGVWAGNWIPTTPQSQVTVSVAALEEQGNSVLAGLATPLTGTVQSAASSDAPAPTTALNSANLVGDLQISPGSWVTILGNRLASGTQSASGPFPDGLIGTEVLIGATSLPLNYVGGSQVNALLPYSLTPNTTVPLLVQRSGTVSAPINITLADLGPAIFSTNGEGTGQGAVLVANSGVVAAPVGTFPGSQPVQRNDFLAIFCTGLGTVTNTPASGAPAPAVAPFATTIATPVVTIGGVQATVTYSGLAPGLVGLYQVNAQVPGSTPTGSAVDLTISVGSLTSNTVTVAVQ